MLDYSLVQVAHVFGLNFTGSNPTISGVSIDTRTLEPGNLFFAIAGEKFDGHDYIQEAKRKGAFGAVVTRKVDVDLPQFVVEDTTKALGQLAADYRSRANIPLIAVTGSSGKTTTKNLITAILQAAYGKDKVLFSEGGLNNHWGLPLTLTRLTDAHRVGVVEMGMNHFNELKYLSDIAKPDVALINNVAACHLQGVGDLEGVARAKAEIFSGLSLQGTAVLNKDDAFFSYWQKQLHGHRVVTFGFDESADLRVGKMSMSPTTMFTLITPHGDVDVELQLLGKHNVGNALAAAAAALVLDVDLAAIKEGLEIVTPISGRLRPLQLPGHITLFDDAYNANPLSVSAAIDTLKEREGKKILVLGDMKELGDGALQYHAEIGQYANACGVDRLYAVGNLTRATCEAFGDNAEHFNSKEELVSALSPQLNPDTNVLVKGSSSMRMQVIVNTLLQQAELESTLL